MRYRGKSRQSKGNNRGQITKPMKEVQSLTRKVTTLNRFVSRVTDKCMPFFKVLKKAFQWTDKCEEALAKLKEYLT